MRAVLAIARKDLRQRLRDRSAIVLGLIAPVVVA
jgi:ABC-type Na+ efflux pump permease subunit